MGRKGIYIYKKGENSGRYKQVQYDVIKDTCYLCVVPRQGDVESAMKYLEMFVELADRSQQLPEQQKACTSLGSIYNSLVRQQLVPVQSTKSSAQRSLFSTLLADLRKL